MNYIGLTAMLIALAVTWKAPEIGNKPSIFVHAEVQSEIAVIIASAVEQNRPEADSVHMDRIWTKATSDSQIAVTFKYSLADSNGVRYETTKGEALVDWEEENTWTIHSVKINEVALEVEKGFSVGDAKTSPSTHQ